MAIKLKNFEDKKAAFATAMQGTDEAAQATAMTDMMDALANDVQADILAKVNTEGMDSAIMGGRGANVLTSSERKFYNAVIEKGGFTDEAILPKTTQERVFEDLRKTHPLLQVIGVQNFGAAIEFIYGDPSGAAVWGPLFGDIKGKLNATFHKATLTQLKLTAFIPLSNDMLDLGPEWVERYVREMLGEAIAAGLERGFVAGTGKDEPIGLLKDLDAAVTAGKHQDKAPTGVLTFANAQTTVHELANAIKGLSKYTRHIDGDAELTEITRNVSGKVVMIVNPFDNYAIQAQATTRNAAGVYVTSLPYNPTIVESAFVPEGQVVFFVQGQYLAAYGGALQMKKFEETLAMEDATLYIAKQYATGMPLDNNAAHIYTLEIPVPGVPVVPGV